MASSAVSHTHSGQLLHPHGPPAGSMMARVDRLDLVVGYLEEMRHGNQGGGSARSSTSPSTPTTFSSSSPPTTPRSAQSRSRCRPAEELLRETRAKGSLVERIGFLESRVLRMEEERLGEERMSMEITSSPSERTGRPSSGMSSADAGGGSSSGRKKKGLKSLVKSCVNRAGGKLKTKD